MTSFCFCRDLKKYVAVPHQAEMVAHALNRLQKVEQRRGNSNAFNVQVGFVCSTLLEFFFVGFFFLQRTVLFKGADILANYSNVAEDQRRWWMYRT